MPKRSEPTEADLIQQRINIALAKSERLVALWLPPPDPKDPPQPSEIALPAAYPPRLGLGATRSEETPYFQQPNARPALQKLLLGRTDLPHAKDLDRYKLKTTRRGPQTAKPRVREKAVEKKESSDEEEGRSSIVRKRKRGPSPAPSQAKDESQAQPSASAQQEPIPNDAPVASGEDGSKPPPIPNMAMIRAQKAMEIRSKAYLDEMLEKRAAKKRVSKKDKKKKKRKERFAKVERAKEVARQNALMPIV